MNSCGPCSLKTGCYLVSLYTFILGILLIGFNGHDFYYGGYQQWSHITAVVVAVCLIFAAICLFLGLRRNSNALIGVWTIIFLIYVIIQIAYIIYSIYNYMVQYDSIPNGLRPSILANIIVFALLIGFNIWSFIAVRSYRGGSGMNIVI